MYREGNLFFMARMGGELQHVERSHHEKSLASSLGTTADRLYCLQKYLQDAGIILRNMLQSGHAIT